MSCKFLCKNPRFSPTPDRYHNPNKTSKSIEVELDLPFGSAVSTNSIFLKWKLKFALVSNFPIPTAVKLANIYWYLVDVHTIPPSKLLQSLVIQNTLEHKFAEYETVGWNYPPTASYIKSSD